MKHWRSILALLLVFGAGIAVGAVGVRTAVRRAMAQAQAHPEQSQNILERSLAWQVRLDNRQREHLHEILTDSRGQLDQLHHSIQPQVVAVFRDTDEEIIAMLTPEQRQRYDRFKRENHPLWRLMTPTTATPNRRPNNQGEGR